MLKTLFNRHPRERIGEPLYAAVAAQARQPGFYTTLGVADRIDARFELYTLHALLLILRLRDEGTEGQTQEGQDGGQGPEAAQALFDTYVSALDNVLRELGVGDVSMARKMRNLGEALYGRMTAYEAPLREGDAATLALHLARNVYESENLERAAALARYALAARETLAGQTFGDVVRAPTWPEIAA